MKSKPLLFLVVASGLLSSPGFSQSRALIVDREQFGCLAEKVRLVPEEPRGVYVDISKCRTKGLRIVRNVFKPMPSVRPDGVETVIYLKPSHLQCIRKNKSKLERIADPAGDGRVRLKIDPCGL